MKCPLCGKNLRAKIVKVGPHKIPMMGFYCRFDNFATQLYSKPSVAADETKSRSKALAASSLNT